MARTYSCYQHSDRPLVAHCDLCSRPCCRDCSVEIFERYLCETCKNKVALDVEKNAVQPRAMIPVALGAAGIFFAGFILGPYAIWRAREAQKLLEHAPWLRGVWHVRAAYFLGGLATVQGVISLLVRFSGTGGG